MSAAERRRLRLGLLVSLLIHVLLLSLSFGGGEGFGLPGLSFPWEERRAEVPELRVVLTPAPPADAQPTEPREDEAAASAEAPMTASTATPEVQPPITAPATPDRLSSELPAAADLHAETPARIAEPAAPAAPAAAERELIALTPAPAADWIVRPPVSASAASPAAAAPASAPSSPQASPTPAPPVLDADAEARRLRVIEEAQDRALALARGEQAKQLAQQQAAQAAQASRAEAERAEAARQALAAEQDAEAKTEAAHVEALKQEMLRQEAARRSLAQLEAARAEAQRQELARLQAALADTARAEAKRLEAARVAAAQQEAAQQEAARQESARQEAARQEAMRQEAARAEAERQEAARAAAARQEAVRQEAAARAEAAQQEAARAELARPDPVKEAAARREAALKAIGRQLNAEAARRDAAAANGASSPRSSSLPLSVSSPRRGRLFGYDDPNTELLLYADAWTRKIVLNQTFEMAREAARQPHVDPLVTVAIRSDGSVESVSFVRSSGVPALDEAIRRIIRSQEHYAEFSPALAREYDVVEIRRTWQFDSAIRLY